MWQDPPWACVLNRHLRPQGYPYPRPSSSFLYLDGTAHTFRDSTWRGPHALEALQLTAPSGAVARCAANQLLVFVTSHVVEHSYCFCVLISSPAAFLSTCVAYWVSCEVTWRARAPVSRYIACKKSSLTVLSTSKLNMVNSVGHTPQWRSDAGSSRCGRRLGTHAAVDARACHRQQRGA